MPGNPDFNISQRPRRLGRTGLQFVAETLAVWSMIVVIYFLGWPFLVALESSPGRENFPVKVLASPIFAEYWIVAILLAVWVSRRAAGRPRSLFACSRAYEWLWLVGIAQLTWSFLQWTSPGEWWKTALRMVFAPVGANISPAPTYSLLAYGLMRRLMRRRTERHSAGVAPPSPARS